MAQSKPDQYNAVGAGQFMQLGASTSEAVGKPGGADKVTPSMSANGMGGGWEETRPGGAEKNAAAPERGDSAFGKPGGSQAIKPA